MTSYARETSTLSVFRADCRTRVRYSPTVWVIRLQFHTVSSKGTCVPFVPLSSPPRKFIENRRIVYRLARSRVSFVELSRTPREVITRAFRSDVGSSGWTNDMKLDVSDVLYDSSSVSSDSGTSQSSRVSHDFLSSIANTAVLPNNVSTDRIIS